MRVVRVATIPFVVLHHLGAQIRALRAAGHEVIVVTSPLEGFERIRELGVARLVSLEIPREISPLADAVALARLWRLYRELRPDIVHSITPKAGLVSALAGRLAGIPVRLHVFTGQAWATRFEPVRSLARLADRMIVALNTRCYADSASQRDFLVAQGIAPRGSVHVLGQGSVAGIDLARFDPARLKPAAAAARQRLAIPPGTKVIVFVGRVTRDKGLAELVAAFTRLAGAVLVLVGPQEPERDPLPEETLREIRRNPAIHAVGYDPHPENYLAMADLLCLPSYREGFGSVVIEAAALGVPCVGTRIPGLVDAVQDGATGVLVPPRDVAALAQALESLLADDARRATLGAAARERAGRDFSSDALNALMLAEYIALAARAR
jgi:glycosyltransferase involved in cell wall biosynthesis